MFDETSDVQMRSLLNIFLNVLFRDGKFKTLTLTLSELEANDADTVYNKLLEILASNNVALNFLIGICSDGCSVMLGKYKGVCTRLRLAVQNFREGIRKTIMDSDVSRTMRSFHPSMGIFVVHCVCHRFALILHDAIQSEYVCSEFIRLLEALYSYFGRSPRRKLALRKVVKEKNDELRKNVKENFAALPDPDDALHNVFKVLCEKHRLPPRIVLTRWLCCREAVHTVIVGRDSYCVYFAEESARLEGDEHAKAHQISAWLQNNVIFAWAYFLEDVIPILTSMNLLFQASLPLPHLLFDSVESAKAAMRTMCGQTPRDDIMPNNEVGEDTLFGAFAEDFIRRNTRGRTYTHGSPLTTSEVLGLKKKWNSCLSYMHDELDDRFPHDSMEVYELLKVVDPVISHSALVHHEVAGMLKISAVTKLLHIFELPLYGILAAEVVLNSFTMYLSSTVAKSTYRAIYKLQDGKRPAPIIIYDFYSQLLHHREMRDWALFALFLLLFPTGNAISERGFSALNATNTKGRYSLSVQQAMATMIISFNGPNYKEFKEVLDRESKVGGKNWWGYVPPTNYSR